MSRFKIPSGYDKEDIRDRKRKINRLQNKNCGRQLCRASVNRVFVRHGLLIDSKKK